MRKEGLKQKETILTYAKRQTLSFDKYPFSELDGAIFSLLSYFNFEALTKYHLPRRLKLKHLLDIDLINDLLIRPAYKTEDEILLKAVCLNPRFKEVRIVNYVKQTSPETEKQFAAITFILPKRTRVMAFRGTDSTLNGWKEDFNMAFKKRVPAQEEAVKYLKKKHGIFTRTVYVTGHSKGGNLAIYAFVNANKRIQRKIKGVFAYDSPGFEKSPVLKKYPTTIHKFIPEQSLIGMLFEEEKDCTVVISAGKLLAQHQIYLWRVSNRGFIRAGGLKKNIARLDAKIARWIRNCSLNERELFIETFYEMLSRTDIPDSVALMSHLLISVKKLFREYKSLDPLRKLAFKHLLFSLVKELF